MPSTATPVEGNIPAPAEGNIRDVVMGEASDMDIGFVLQSIATLAHPDGSKPKGLLEAAGQIAKATAELVLKWGNHHTVRADANARELAKQWSAASAPAPGSKPTPQEGLSEKLLSKVDDVLRVVRQLQYTQGLGSDKDKRRAVQLINEDKAINRAERDAQERKAAIIALEKQEQLSYANVVRSKPTGSNSTPQQTQQAQQAQQEATTQGNKGSSPFLAIVVCHKEPIGDDSKDEITPLRYNMENIIQQTHSQFFVARIETVDAKQPREREIVLMKTPEGEMVDSTQLVRLVADSYSAAFSKAHGPTNPIVGKWLRTPLMALVARAVPLRSEEDASIKLRGDNPKVNWGCDRPFIAMSSKRRPKRGGKAKTHAVQFWVAESAAKEVLQKGLTYLRADGSRVKLEICPYKPQRAGQQRPPPEATPQGTKRQPEHRQSEQAPAEDGGAGWTKVQSYKGKRQRTRGRSSTPRPYDARNQREARPNQSQRYQW